MKISTKGRYALRFMLDLAAHGEGRYVPLKEISARQGVSLKYLEQIVSQFGKLGLLESVRDRRVAIVWQNGQRITQWVRSCGMRKASWLRWPAWSRRSIPAPARLNVRLCRSGKGFTR